MFKPIYVFATTENIVQNLLSRPSATYVFLFWTQLNWAFSLKHSIQILYVIFCPIQKYIFFTGVY